MDRNDFRVYDKTSLYHAFGKKENTSKVKKNVKQTTNEVEKNIESNTNKAEKAFEKVKKNRAIEKEKDVKKSEQAFDKIAKNNVVKDGTTNNTRKKR